MPFRSDILRGVRLFLIAFAAILLCSLAYQMLRPAAEARSVPQTAGAAGQSAPTAEEVPSPEPHPLVVPPPPPVPGETPAPRPAVKVSHPRQTIDTTVPPPPPMVPSVRGTRTTAHAPSVREPAPDAGTSGAPAAVEPSPAPEPGGVGYKSLIEADPNRPPAEAAAQPAPAAPEPAKKPEGSRIKRGLGRILRLGKKDTTQP